MYSNASMTNLPSDRISSLRDRLQGIQSNMAGQKVAQYDKIRYRMGALEEKMKFSVDSRAEILVGLAGDINKLEQNLEDTIAQRELMMTTKRLELKQMEEKIFDHIEAQSVERKTVEKKLMPLIENRSNMIRSDIGRESAIQEESVDCLKAYFEVWIRFGHRFVG